MFCIGWTEFYRSGWKTFTHIYTFQESLYPYHPSAYQVNTHGANDMNTDFQYQVLLHLVKHYDYRIKFDYFIPVLFRTSCPINR